MINVSVESQRLRRLIPMSNPFLTVALLDIGIIGSYFLPTPEPVKWVINLVIGAVAGYIFYRASGCRDKCKR